MDDTSPKMCPDPLVQILCWNRQGRILEEVKSGIHYVCHIMYLDVREVEGRNTSVRESGTQRTGARRPRDASSKGRNIGDFSLLDT
jgi:hypothetical protein